MGSSTGRGATTSSTASAAGKASPTPRDVKVVLVDDHPLWRETLRKVLDRDREIEVVGEAGSAEAAAAIVGETVPDVVIMDIDLPAANGIEATGALLSRQPELKVLVLSASDDRSMVIEAMRAGAAGYLVKTAGAREVADAVLRVYSGELALPPELVRIVMAEIRGDGRTTELSGLAALSDSEREVLSLMAAGRTNQAIADQMNVSPKTVESRVTNIYLKLGLEPTADDHRRVLAVITFLADAGAIPGAEPPGRS